MIVFIPDMRPDSRLPCQIEIDESLFKLALYLYHEVCGAVGDDTASYCHSRIVYRFLLWIKTIFSSLRARRRLNLFPKLFVSI